MEKLYQRINYENSPSKKTPLSEANLNKMDKALDDLDNRIIEQDAAFAKSIEAEGKKIEEVNGKISTLTDTAATLTQSKSDAITVEKSGTTIVATDSSDKGFEQFKTFGWSVQDKTSGKNLLKSVAKTNVQDGITYTVYDDGTVSASGTATATTALLIVGDSVAGVREKLLGKEVILSGCPVGGSGSTYKLQCFNYSGEDIASMDFGSGTRFTFTNADKGFNVAIIVYKGMTVSNLMFKPMIRLASDPDDTYEPYTNGPSPNPEYEQPIVSAGQMLAEGNQLFDVNSLTVTHSGSAECKVENDAIVITKTSNTSTAFVLVDLGAANDWNGQDITLSFEADNGYNVSLGYADADGQNRTLVHGVTNVKQITLKINGTTYANKRVVAWFYADQNTAVSGTSTIYRNIMLNVGSTALPWEPYTGGVKKAYDVGIRKKLTGKNLFDSSIKQGYYIVPNGTFASNSYWVSIAENIPCKSGDTLYVNTKANVALDGTRFTFFTGNAYLSHITLEGLSEGEVIVPEGANSVCISFAKTNILPSNIEDVFVAVKTGYIHLDRVLRGIPVTDASLANYTDENGQMWCADYVDKARKVLVQRIGKINPKASEFVVVTNGYVSYPIGDLPKNAYIFMSNIGTDISTGLSYVNFRTSYTLDEFKNLLADKDIFVYYPLATPIETPLTDEEIAAYKALHTNKPNTIITNDVGCFMEVKYVADTKTHIEQNYVPVSKYTSLEDRVSALERLYV